MINDSRRLQNSTLISSGFHGVIFVLYLFMRASTSHDTPVITHVEFLDLRPPAQEETAATPGPAQRAPRSIRDFIRMAIPQMNEQEPQEAAPRDMPLDKAMPQSNFAPSQSIKLDQRNLAHGGTIKLRADAPMRENTENISDMGARPQNSTAMDMTSPSDVPSPSINIEAVGRKAVRVGGPSIRLDNNSGPSRGSSSLTDISAPSGGTPSPGALADTTPSGISINDNAGPRRQAKMGSLPIGYSGGGGGISLSDKPGVRGGGGGVVMPSAPSTPAAAEKLQNRPDKSRNKGIEISGPLAHRKIIVLAPPGYPDWAKQQGIEAEVSIRFFVSSDGHVLERMLIERTSGYKEIDDLAMESLKKWVFVAISDNEEDQWGIVTFRFKLK